MSETQGALLRGLRRRGDEAQLTQALAALAQADGAFARSFLTLVLRGHLSAVPHDLEVAAEEIVADGRVDLRSRAAGFDAIVELKIHAGYGHNQVERYLAALERSGAPERHLVAITRDVQLYGEPILDGQTAWRGSQQWRALFPELKLLRFDNAGLARQWLLLLDILEMEGSMGFTKPDPELFDAFARARVAAKHMDDFLRVLQAPLLNALRDALGGGENVAGLYWASGRRFARTRWGRLDIPFRVPAGGPGRVRAGLIGWNPPATFYVQPAPDQRWDRQQFRPEAERALKALLDAGFDPVYMRQYLRLDAELTSASDLEERVVTWAHARFVELAQSGLLELPVEAFGVPTAAEAEVEEPI